MAALFNAPSSLDNHYTMLVNHDLYGAAHKAAFSAPRTWGERSFA